MLNEAAQRHDVFVLRASDGDDEGGPALTLVCAQAAGMPVVTTDFPGSELSVSHGETGWLCPQGDPAALADRMAWLVEHRESWAPVGRAASDRVRADFSLEGQLEELVGMYRHVVGERPSVVGG
jgi:colanic acid/amylovoran biosynthesis glycosyltransferase